MNDKNPYMHLKFSKFRRLTTRLSDFEGDFYIKGTRMSIHVRQ